jgi:hypothetical protein
VQNLTINSTNSLTINSNAINVTGNLTNTVGSTGVGTTQINLVGTGSWSNTGASPTTAYLRNPVTINTSGTITLGAAVAIINTTTYSAGTINSVANSSTIYCTDQTLVGFGATSSSYLNNLSFVTSGTFTINTSAAYFLGTVTEAGTVNNTSSSTFGFSANTLSITTIGTYDFKPATEYIVRGQLVLNGQPPPSTITLRQTNGTGSRFRLTLNYGATQRVRYVSAQNIDSSNGQTIWNYKPNFNTTNTINWGSLVTPTTVSSSWVN